MILRRYHKKREEKQATEEVEEVEETTEETAEEKTKLLDDMTVPELKEIAKNEDIEGYNNMKKEELIEALKSR